MKTILFISKGEAAPSTRYRAMAYFNRLRSDGWTPVHLTAQRSLVPRLRILRMAAAADVVVVLRKTFGLYYINLLRKFSRRLFFDFDDAIYCQSDGRSSSSKMKRFRNAVRLCDGVWAGNHYLGRVAQAYQPNVWVLPTALDPLKYECPADKPDNRLVFVWIGSKSTRKYLKAELPTLETLAQRLMPMELKIVADFSLAADRLPISTVPWSEATEAEALLTSHIGIAPMPDNERTRGKCGLKVLQYMAAALPVISSPTGVNAEIIEDGKTGFLPHNDQEWYQAAKQLNENPMLRERIGQAGRRKVRREYSIGAVYQTMKRCLDEMSLRRS
jgi:glycosyltransferase involved in cell wall biosynthesis